MNREQQQKILDRQKNIGIVFMLFGVILFIYLSTSTQLFLAFLGGVILFIPGAVNFYNSTKGIIGDEKSRKKAERFNKEKEREKKKEEWDKEIREAKEKMDKEFQQKMGMTREEFNKKEEERKVEEKKKEDAITELKKHKEQLDLELITQEEYDQHKERLGKIIKG